MLLRRLSRPAILPARVVLSAVLVAALVALLACSSEKQVGEEGKAAPQQAGQEAREEAAPRPAPQPMTTGEKSLQILPGKAYVDSTLELKAKGFGLEGTKVVWLLNGRPVSTVDPYRFQVKALEARKGDSIQAKAEVDGVEVYSNDVTIQNSKPTLTHVKLMPEAFKPGENFRIDAEVADADGDPVSIFYEWKKNGQQVGTGKELDVPLTRGDAFTVTVIPYDGSEHGEFVYLEREVYNLPPMFVKSEKFILAGNTFTFILNATDPDGDPLTYSLRTGPEGMTVNPSTGVVLWETPKDLLGRTDFTVAAEDGNGGSVEMTYSVDLTSPKKTGKDKGQDAQPEK